MVFLDLSIFPRGFSRGFFLDDHRNMDGFFCWPSAIELGELTMCKITLHVWFFPTLILNNGELWWAMFARIMECNPPRNVHLILPNTPWFNFLEEATLKDVLDVQGISGLCQNHSFRNWKTTLSIVDNSHLPSKTATNYPLVNVYVKNYAFNLTFFYWDNSLCHTISMAIFNETISIFPSFSITFHHFP